MSTSLPIKLNNYTLTEKIGETSNSIVYRGVRNGSRKTVVVKALRAPHMSAAQATGLKHEYDIIRRIDIDGIIKTIDFIDQDGMLALVLEDFGGISLKQLIPEGFSLDRFLKLAIRLTEILGKVHQANITHRDIKPHNILLNPENDIIKITDFGIAAETLPIDQEISNPILMEGTLPYIAPEQTGRMNCAVDYRTDLYSLGVTFYEMLTGQVPFRAQSASEIIHAHIARAPVAPHQINPEIPVPVSDIILKLLSKPAADRYQNGFGLAADLRECLKQLQMTGEIKPFPLGAQDVSPHFIIPQILAGREKERYALLEAFERVSHGWTEFLLVTGEEGSGKSSLVHEMSKSLIGKRGYFITGKFDQFCRNLPYSAIIQAFQGFVLQLLTQNDEQLHALKEKLLAALAPNGRIITDAIADIELIIGKQPDVPDLAPEETQNRFDTCFRNFLRVFASEDHPLVVFMDDLQWADRASLRLLQMLASDRDLRYTLFIGALRDTELPSDHPLVHARNAIRTAGIEVRTLHMTALTQDVIGSLIESTLQCPPDVSLPLAKVVYDKTKGNPFFVHQFLKMLYDRHYLVFDPASGWTWDLQEIHLLQVTENVVQFMSDKLYRLPPDQLEIIKLCAGIGNRFDIETLVFLSRRPLNGILSIVDALVNDGVINLSEGIYRFSHNRIQEAAYLLLKPEQREQIHYEIGHRELFATGPEQAPNRIFYICDHLNLAHHLLTAQERIRLAELNLKAGIKAKESTAYAAAAGYFEIGIELLGRDVWQKAYDLTYLLHSEQMECQYLNRNFHETERLFNVILVNATTKFDKAKAFNTMITLNTTIRPPREAVELGLTALKIFGFDLKLDMGRGPALIELVKAGHHLKKIGIDNVPALPRMQDRDILVAGELMLNTGYPAYYMNKNLVAFMSMRVANDCLQHGLAPYAGIAFIVMANIIQISLGNYELAYRLSEMALQVNEILDNRKLKGAVLHNFAYFIQHWKKHIRHDLELYLTVYELSVNTGDFIFVGHSINASAEIRLMLDHRLDDIHEELKTHQDFITLSKNPVISREYRQIIQFIQALKGQTPVRHDLSGNNLDLSEYLEQTRAEGNDFGLCLALYHKMVLLFLYRKHGDALRAAQELDQHAAVFLGTIMMANHYFYYSLILIAFLKEGGTRRRRKYKAVVRRNLRTLKKWADLCPENFKHMHDLIAAELAAMEGRFRQAVELYHIAINNAHNNDFLPIEAIACELLAAFYIRWNHQAEAGVFIRRARNCYTFWGATAKEQDLQERYPDLLRQDKTAKSANTDTRTTTSDSSSRALDLAMVMEVSQVLSSEIRLENLLQKTMHLSITSAGAQCGYLFLVSSDGRLKVQASEDVLTGESQVLQAVALDDCGGVSPSVVHYVYRSGSPLVLGNAGREENFRNDPHIVEHRCKSILCLPVLNKGTVAAVLYMENNLASDAFTPQHLKILQIISSQAAISLQNAKLYEDITAEINVRKKTEDALRISEEKYRTILEEMQDIYSETDLHGIITFVNPALCSLTGYTKDELIGSNIGILTPNERSRFKHHYYRQTYANSQASLFTADIIGKNGKATCLENIVTPIRAKAGKITGFRNLGRDITERKRLEQHLIESHQKMQDVRIATILGLAKLAEYRDEDTGAHLERIREYARILAQELAVQPKYNGYITPEYIEDIYNSSILHDIGKVGIPDAILLKPGKLTSEEFDVIKIHTTLGGDVLKAVEGKINGQSFLTLGKEIAYYHHEKWNGTGYPHGLGGEDIPLSARIVAVADVYDALTSKRVYKEAFSHLQAMDMIVRDRGAHFAPDVVDAFMIHAEDFRKIREELPGN